MSDPDKAPDVRRVEGFDRAGYPTTSAQINDSRGRRPIVRPPTQAERVFKMLSRGWVCGSEFLEAHLPRYSSRIHELRQDGWYVTRRPCSHPWHRHESVQWQWTIERKPPEDGQLFGDIA
jgi:predicted RNA binding protein YcfA (HicA-like mRNA interferase family)